MAAGSDIARRLRALNHLTTARIGLPVVGAALGTRDLLAFDLACAQARDAVTRPLDTVALREALAPLSTIRVHSAAMNRAAYLRYPDRGRQLDAESAARLPACQPDLAIILGDGLSSHAVERHGPHLVREILARIPDLSIGPLVIAEQARVALADHVGERMQARCAVMLIGERPGLTTNDSLGLYLTYDPRRGRTDAEKNCISNIHPSGLAYAEAAEQAVHLVRRALALRYSGIDLKPDDLSDEERLTDAGNNDVERQAAFAVRNILPPAISPASDA